MRLLFTLGLLVPLAASAADAADQATARALLKPRHEALLSSEIAARVLSLPHREGERFKQGEPLVEFDCDLYEAQRAATKAKLDGAERTLANNRQRAALQSIGALEVGLAQSEVEKARAELRVAEIQAGRCRIAAPYDGRVVELKVHEHEGVPAGRELLSILDDGGFEVEAIVPSGWLRWLKPGQSFELLVDETGRRYPAHVVRLGARIDPVSQSIKLLAAIDGPGDGLVAGMSGSALFTPPAE